MPALTMVSDYRIAVRLLSSVGIEPPEGYAELNERLVAFEAMGTPQTDKLIAAIIAGDGPVDELRAQAMAERASVSVNQVVRDAVVAHTIGMLRGLAPYPKVQGMFNGAWARFVKAADLVDVDETNSEVIAEWDAKRLTAWRDSKAIAGELDKLLSALSAAAQLSGQPHPAANDESAPSVHRDPEFELGLVVDPTGLHVRRLWEHYASDGRCGRWAGLHRLGAKVAAKDLSDYAPQRRPRPTLERRTENGPITIDPEDDLLAEAVAAAE